MKKLSIICAAVLAFCCISGCNNSESSSTSETTASTTKVTTKATTKATTKPTIVTHKITTTTSKSDRIISDKNVTKITLGNADDVTRLDELDSILGGTPGIDCAGKIAGYDTYAYYLSESDFTGCYGPCSLFISSGAGNKIDMISYYYPPMEGVYSKAPDTTFSYNEAKSYFNKLKEIVKSNAETKGFSLSEDTDDKYTCCDSNFVMAAAIVQNDDGSYSAMLTYGFVS